MLGIIMRILGRSKGIYGMAILLTALLIAGMVTLILNQLQ
jgi:hypothetical protein